MIFNYKALIFTFLFIALYQLNFAQSYGTTLGLRLGNNDQFRMGGLTIQQRIFKKITLEGICQTDFRHNHTLHLLIERHKNIITKRLNFYAGAGISLGSEENTTTTKYPDQTISITTYNNGTIGVDLIAGLELTLLKYNLSLDYKPNFNMTGRDQWYQGQVGISLRAVIISGKTWNKQNKARKKEKNSKVQNSNSQPKKEYPTMGEFINGLFNKADE